MYVCMYVDEECSVECGVVYECSYGRFKETYVLLGKSTNR